MAPTACCWIPRVPRCGRLHPWSGQARPSPQTTTWILRPILLTPDVYRFAQTLNWLASLSELWHAPSLLLAGGPPPGSAATSLLSAVDAFYALSLVNAALRGVSIMDGAPSRVCLCTADAFYLQAPFGGLWRSKLCVSPRSRLQARTSSSDTMQRDILAHYYVLPRCDHLYFLLRLLPILISWRCCTSTLNCAGASRIFH